MESINYLAILIGAIAHMILGMTWYSQALFGVKWMTLMGMKNPKSMSKAEMKKMQESAMPAHIATFVSALIVGLVISLALQSMNMAGINAGVTTAFFAWFGFSFTAGVTDYMYGGRKCELFMINYGFYLISFLVIGAIIGGWPV